MGGVNAPFPTAPVQPQSAPSAPSQYALPPLPVGLEWSKKALGDPFQVMVGNPKAQLDGNSGQAFLKWRTFIVARLSAHKDRESQQWVHPFVCLSYKYLVGYLKSSAIVEESHAYNLAVAAMPAWLQLAADWDARYAPALHERDLVGFFETVIFHTLRAGINIGASVDELSWHNMCMHFDEDGAPKQDARPSAYINRMVRLRESIGVSRFTAMQALEHIMLGLPDVIRPKLVAKKYHFLTADCSDIRVEAFCTKADELYVRAVTDRNQTPGLPSLFDKEPANPSVPLLPAPLKGQAHRVAAVHSSSTPSSKVSTSAAQSAPESKTVASATAATSASKTSYPVIVKGPAQWLAAPCDHFRHQYSATPVRPHTRAECHQYSKDQAT